MRVKVCGITRADDARHAASLGAWAVGFVFWPRSPRYVEPSAAREIVASLPTSVLAVGVFVDQPAEYVETVARHVGLGAVQLHGHETPTYAKSMTRHVIKALSLDDAAEEMTRGDWHAATVLLDAVEDERRGGTGRAVDWARAAAIARQRSVVLAGGLRPDNAIDAIRIVQPVALDVSSGVERAPGEKDGELMEALFAAVAAGRGEAT